MRSLHPNSPRLAVVQTESVRVCILEYPLYFWNNLPCTETNLPTLSVVLYPSLSLMCLCFLNSMLADKLNMTPEDAERWIVNLIRNARLDAKIDSKLVRPSVFFFLSQFA